jgi:NTP pyrophosphatase (non-canonical NTP hydrolase)
VDRVRRDVAGLVAWLDAHATGSPETTRVMRVLKLSEEVGEVAEALIGATGNNPRKPPRTWQDVERELCDVVLTAMVALRSLNPAAEDVFADHLARVTARSRDLPPPTRHT